VQGEKLFFDEFDELFRKFGDSSIFAFAKLIAQAKSVNCGKDFAKRVEIAEEVHRVNRYAPAADVSVALNHNVIRKSVPDDGSGCVSHYRKRATGIWCVVLSGGLTTCKVAKRKMDVLMKDVREVDGSEGARIKALRLL
jgi:hypothetical protein